jgi:hypothetical protein
VQASGEDHGAVLVVNRENKIEKRDVNLGLQTASDDEIISGLKEGELVLYGEQSQYKPGQLVVPQIVAPSGLE